jgi:hypothetical protein
MPLNGAGNIDRAAVQAQLRVAWIDKGGSMMARQDWTAR